MESESLSQEHWRFIANQEVHQHSYNTLRKIRIFFGWGKSFGGGSLFFFPATRAELPCQRQPMASRPQVWDIFAAVQFLLRWRLFSYEWGSQSQLKKLWDGNDQPESETKAGENYEGLPFHGLLRWGAQLYHGQWSPPSRTGLGPDWDRTGTVGPWGAGVDLYWSALRYQVRSQYWLHRSIPDVCRGLPHRGVPITRSCGGWIPPSWDYCMLSCHSFIKQYRIRVCHHLT